MSGTGQPPTPPVYIAGEQTIETEDEALAIALDMCPDGKWIEIHDRDCDVRECTCVPRRLTKGAKA